MWIPYRWGPVKKDDQWCRRRREDGGVADDTDVAQLHVAGNDSTESATAGASRAAQPGAARSRQPQAMKKTKRYVSGPKQRIQPQHPGSSRHINQAYDAAHG